jgi:hypothetical protein
MRKHLFLLTVATGFALGFAAAGAAPVGKGAKLEAKSTDKVPNADAVSAAVEKETAVVRITYQRGIGRAEVKLTEGTWPGKMRLEFQGFKNMEQVRLEYGNLRLTTSLGRAPKLTFEERKGDGKYVEVATPPGMTMPVAKKGGNIVVEVPAVFNAKEATLKLSWVDEFRQ